MYVYALCVCCTYGDQKKDLDGLGLELQTIVSHVDPDPLQEKPVFLPTEPSLQPQQAIL